MQLKFEIIYTRIDQVIGLKNDINFSETPRIIMIVIIIIIMSRHKHKYP